MSEEVENLRAYEKYLLEQQIKREIEMREEGKIIRAYDEYLLEQELKKNIKPKLLEEKEILEILRVLHKSFSHRENGFYVSEILYVGMKVYWRGYSEIMYNEILREKLWLAKRDGKVVFTNERKWKLAPEKETPKSETESTEKTRKTFDELYLTDSCP